MESDKYFVVVAVNPAQLGRGRLIGSALRKRPESVQRDFVQRRYAFTELLHREMVWKE